MILRKRTKVATNTGRVLSNKKGSYIVEASITLPVYVLCVIALTLLIGVLQVISSICFSTAEELEKLDFLCYKLGDYAALEVAALRKNVLDCDPRLSNLSITNFDCMYTDNGIDDLVLLGEKVEFKVANPIGILGEIEFTQSVLSRAYTGKLERGQTLSVEDFEDDGLSRIVVIFPKYGIRYHIEDCRYVVQDYEGEECKLTMQLFDARRKGYTPCLVCQGGEDEDG